MSEIDFKLTGSEIHSALWKKIKEHLEERIALNRKKNDGDLTPERTAKVRGRIAEDFYVLGLGQPDAPENLAFNDDPM